MDDSKNDAVDGLKDYIANNFLTRQGDKELMADFVKRLRGKVETKTDSESF